MPVRPVIGMITAPNPKLLHGRHLINTSYVRAVIAAGGTPLLIPSDGDNGLAAEYLPLLRDPRPVRGGSPASGHLHE